LSKTLTVIVPVYYNAGSIPLLFQRLTLVEQQLAALGVRLQLVFVEDGSGDDSLAELLKVKAARPETTVIELTRNFGAEAATKSGLMHATGDCFVILSADLQDPPELIPDLARRWLGGARFVVCERESREDPVVSKLFSAAYYRMLRLFVMPDYPAGGYDLALFDHAFLPYLRNAPKSCPTLVLAYSLGFKPEIIKYGRQQRLHGKSRWTFGKKVTSAVDSLLWFSVKPLRLMTMVGMTTAAVSFVYAIVIILYALTGQREVPGFATIVSLISFLMGVIMVMLGIVGEYLARILNELHRGPEAVISRIH
jgi:dolichol-phosphate mannosyltransferase